MSNLISCKSLTKSFGAQTLFSGVELVIHKGDRIGLIGPNGSGKSTLLKIIGGREDADTGEIITGKHIRISYLAQTDTFAEDRSIADNLYSSMANLEMDEAERHNCVNTVLSRAQFSDAARTVSSLSGGWRKRLAICRALLGNPQILILDEPTNHLDMEGIIWLEKLLAGGVADGPQAFLLVSHDRKFLENCSNRIIELSSRYPQGTFQIDGSYSIFLEKREKYLYQQSELEDRLNNKVRRETEWLRRGPKARTSKARYRIDEAHRLQNELEKVKRRNKSTQQVGIDFEGTGRKTKKLLEATGLKQSYGDVRLYSGVNVLLKPGSRLGLLGRNGCGKSTLMKMLAQGDNYHGSAVGGGSIKTADKVKIVYFDQHRESLDPQITLRRALAPEGDSVVYQGRSLHVVSWAKRFLFQADQLETPVGELSGGEQARILIASLMLQPADILLLDEPTNDLDIDSLDVLEESFLEFPGALVLVSHDRYLLDQVCDQFLGFDGMGGVAYYADYQQWLTALFEAEKISISTQNKKQTSQDKPRSKAKNWAGRLSYLDQREFDQIEEKIMEAETNLEEVQKKLEAPATVADATKLSEYWQKMESLKNDIECMYQRWEELEEKKNSPETY